MNMKLYDKVKTMLQNAQDDEKENIKEILDNLTSEYLSMFTSGRIFTIITVNISFIVLCHNIDDKSITVMDKNAHFSNIPYEDLIGDYDKIAIFDRSEIIGTTPIEFKPNYDSVIYMPEKSSLVSSFSNDNKEENSEDVVDEKINDDENIVGE